MPGGKEGMMIPEKKIRRWRCRNQDFLKSKRASEIAGPVTY